MLRPTFVYAHNSATFFYRANLLFHRDIRLLGPFLFYLLSTRVFQANHNILFLNELWLMNETCKTY
jgi:hypothetical protein